MKREIKFRAYDKVKKEWLLGYELPNLGGFSMFGEMMMMGEYENLLSSYFPDRLDNIVLMQYTGLKDKNEKEIYEGDITESGVVTFIGGRYVIIDNKTGDWEDLIGDEDEVIGNIYETPELLLTDTLDKNL